MMERRCRGRRDKSRIEDRVQAAGYTRDSGSAEDCSEPSAYLADSSLMLCQGIGRCLGKVNGRGSSRG